MKKAVMTLVLAASGSAAGCAGSTAPVGTPAPGPGSVVAADGTPLARVGGLGGLDGHLARVARSRLRRGAVRTAIEPGLQQELVRQLEGVPGAGVIVDVSSGRLLAAAGNGGRSPWRSLQAPGSTMKAVLAAGALSARRVTTSTRLNGNDGPGGVLNAGGQRLGPLTLEQALVRSSNTAFADLSVRLGAADIDDLLRRTGFDAGPRAADLQGFVGRSRGGRLQERGTHGVGSAPNFVDAAGNYRDLDSRARVTTFQLAQVALALASAGERNDIGVTRPGPEPLEGTWTREAGRAVRRMMAAAVRSGPARTARSERVAVGAKTGTMPTAGGRTALSMIGFAPAGDPEIAVALTALGEHGSDAGEVLGPKLRRLLEARRA